MIIYQGSTEEFNQDVIQNQVADKIAKNFEGYFHRVNEREYRSWAISLQILNNSFVYAGLKENYLLVEYQLPYSSKRIDVLVFGKNSLGEENVVILELKQWSKKEIKNFPIFSKEDSLGLSNYLKERLQQGKGKLVFQRFSGSPINPSKRLLDHTSEMINN